ncbi:MAG: 4Fe-4S binding protein [Candidatus Theseobacter exili]|nr:4Fe-4S binding protein [Candidatus Theseobacter exili]
MKYCLALRTTYGLNMPMMFRAESVAMIDSSKCSGCKACINICQFNAIHHHESDKKCHISIKKCVGCGVCRNVCEVKAIALENRSSHPEANAFW